VLAVREILDRLIAHASVPIPTRCDSYLLRPADITLQVPCVDKFENETGWQPKYSLDQSIEFLLDFWRRRADQTVRTLAAAKGE
jgi:nucleoside-diphosphate-sugar epimerase